VKTCLSCGRDLSTPPSMGCLDCENVQFIENELRRRGLLRVGDPLTRSDEENRIKGWPWWQIVDAGPPVKVTLVQGK